MKRFVPVAVLCAVLLSGIQQVSGRSLQVAAQAGCSQTTITAYSVEQYPGTTTDGTRTPGNAGVIAAASYNYALGAFITVEGLGTYRVADRGHLGANHVDVLMQTTREALQFGRQTRTVCQ